MEKISGIYKITNIITGDFYIGSSKNIMKRWANHKSPSKQAEHTGIKLYQAFSKYGLDKFSFEILEETNNLREREEYWIEKLNPIYNSLRAKRTNEERLAQTKEWCDIHRDELRAQMRKYNSRLCFYNGETLTLGALRGRFRRQGIPHDMLEAKKYLLEN